MAYCGDANPDGTLSLNHLSLEGPGGSVHCLDPNTFWQRGKKRGTERLVPFSTGLATGVVNYPRRYKPTARTVHIGVCGNVSILDGSRFVDWRAGLEFNLEYLNANICDPTSSPNNDGTVLAELIMPSTTLRTAWVHIEDEIEELSRIEAEDELGAMDELAICAIHVTIGAAYLAPV